MARILNNFFNDSKYVSINDLYNKFFKEYQIEYFKSIKKFENELLGKNIKQIVSLWGPFSEKQIIDNNTSQYVWTYKKHITRTLGTSESTALIEKNENSLVNNSTSGNIFSESNLTSKSNYYSDGLGIVKDSYTNSSDNYFLNFYSNNMLYSNSVTLSQNTSNYSSLSIESEESKKIALLVDENNLIIDVLTKNYFSEPDYGVTISFIDL